MMSVMEIHLTPALLPNSHSKRSSPPIPMPQHNHHLYRNIFYSLPLFLQPKLKHAFLSLYSNLEQFTV